jgi:hypothetical protein
MWRNWARLFAAATPFLFAGVIATVTVGPELESGRCPIELKLPPEPPSFGGGRASPPPKEPVIDPWELVPI